MLVKTQTLGTLRARVVPLNLEALRRLSERLALGEAPNPLSGTGPVTELSLGPLVQIGPANGEETKRETDVDTPYRAKLNLQITVYHLDEALSFSSARSPSCPGSPQRTPLVLALQ